MDHHWPKTIYLDNRNRKNWGKTVCVCAFFFFFFPLYFYIFNSNQLVNRRGRERAEEQVSGCGHLKPCGSPDHHRPFHSTCSRSSSSSSSSSTQKSYYYNWLYKSPYKSSVCVCVFLSDTRWGEEGGEERRRGNLEKNKKIYVQTQQTVQTFSLTSVPNWELDNTKKMAEERL